MRVAVIPARGGSKRIPRKNIRPFHGKPIIAWSIAAALESGVVDRVIVSTDDEEIAGTAVRWGADVPFLRPPELSDDRAGTVPVIRHSVEWLRDEGTAPSYVCCLYATAPLVSGGDIAHALRIIETGGHDYVFSATTFPFPIQRALRISEGGRVEMLHPDNFNTRSQDLETTYHDAGQFYWGTAAAWLDARPVFLANSRALILPRYRVQDIDTEEDWRLAELMFATGAQRDAT